MAFGVPSLITRFGDDGLINTYTGIALGLTFIGGYLIYEGRKILLARYSGLEDILDD